MAYFRMIDNRVLAEGALRMMRSTDRPAPVSAEAFRPLSGKEYLRRITARNLSLAISRGFVNHQLYLLPGIIRPGDFLKRQSGDDIQAGDKKRAKRDSKSKPKGGRHE